MDSFTYEYRGSEFLLDQASWYHKDSYKIKGIVTESEKLYLPEQYKDSKHIIHWDMNKNEKPLSSVKFLYIPAGITEIFITNRIFPNLESIEIQSNNTKFSTDGQMIFSADRKELLYSLAAGNKKSATVPKTVKKIGNNAFEYSSCTEIIFQNPEVSAANNSFNESEWLDRQGDYCIVGNTFYRLKHPVDILEVPENIRHFQENAFFYGVPNHIITPIVPPRNCITDLSGDSYRNNGICRELTITRPNAALNLGTFGELSGLQKIHLPQNHKKYCSEDGVIFSKDRKSLVFYPRGRQNIQYNIPNGTVKIAKEAFAKQRYLEDVYMPDTVKMLGMSAFYGCRALRKVTFSDNIREIPDSSAYQNGGVFQSCKSLYEVTFPSKLQYLGSFAFYCSGLGKVVINEKLRQIGEYAFSGCQLKKVRLPASVERLGKGSLAGIEWIDAYAGTAKGLVSAVNTVPPDVSEKRMNIKWGRCRVHVQHKKGDKAETFLIPASLKRTAAYHLDMAWNSDSIDYEEYDACFEEITDPEERLEFAELGILRLKGEEDTPYVSYMKHSALRIASRLLEEKKEKEFLAFLEKGYLAETAYKKLLKIANEKELTTCSAYLLKYQNAQSRKKTRRFIV